MIQDKLVYAETVRVHYESYGELIPGLALTIQTHLVMGLIVRPDWSWDGCDVLGAAGGRPL